MICPKCHQVIPDESKFCEHCGAKIESAQQTTQPEANSQKTVQEESIPTGNTQPDGPQHWEATHTATEQPSQKPASKFLTKQNLIKFGIPAAAALVIILVAIVLIATHKKKIDLQDYTTVEFSGYEKHGTAALEFDRTKLSEALAKSAGINTDTKDLKDMDSLSDLQDMLSSKKVTKYAKMYQLLEEIEYKLDKTSGLKNGDVVTVTFEFNNETAKELGVRFVGEPMEFTVEGLKEIKEVDAFASLKVEFNGTSPNASVSLNNESTEEGISNLYFTAEPSSDLKIGDKIKVSVDYDEEQFIENYGCVLSATEKEYTVENVDSYIEKADDISKEVLGQMKGQTEDSIKSYFAKEKAEISYSGLTYEGYYFLTNKTTDTWNSHNIVYIVYSAKVKSKSKSFQASTVYLPVKFSNVIRYADGTVYVDLNSTTIEGSTELSYGWFGKVSGFESKSDMKNQLVTAEKATYNDEAKDGLEN